MTKLWIQERESLKTRDLTFLPLQISLFVFVLLGLLTSSVTLGIFFPKYTTRFCYNSPNVTVNSQCVYCNYFTFDATVLGCTGSSAVTINMTSSQAFCVIAQCLGQVRQTPIFLGRKKRSSGDETTTETANETKMSSESDADGGNGNETKISSESDADGRNGNETMTSGESSRSDTNESSEETVSVEMSKNETGTTEPSQFPATTQIIEFTYNGQRERYIVAQEVRVEVYNPDPLFDMDTDYELNDISNEPDAKNDSIVNRDKIH